MSLADFIYDKPVIDAGCIILRPMTAADAPALSEWMPDPEMYTYWGKAPSKAEKDPKLLFDKEDRAVRSFHLGVARRDGNKVIGDVWVYQIEKDRMASVALRIAKAYQGQGYGTKALAAMTDFCFEKTELQRLWTEVDIRNLASCRVLEHCGYTREGLIRQGKMINVWCDYYIYGILRSDRTE